MARIKRNIQTVSGRRELEPRKEPYWHRVSKGNYLGFRKMSSTTEGTWSARAYNPKTGEQDYRPLGHFDEFVPSERFDKAEEAANEWFKHIGVGGSRERNTMRVVCERYVTALRKGTTGKKKKPNPKAAEDAQARFDRYVLDDPKFANTLVDKLEREQIEEWREKVRGQPKMQGKRRPGKTPEAIARRKKAEVLAALAPAAAAPAPRSEATINRDITCLRAALNLAQKHGLVSTDLAWREALEPAEEEEATRSYLTPEQRKRLIEAAEPAPAMLLRGLSVLPFRPGALAYLTVDRWQSHTRELTVGKDKAGGNRKLRLPASTAQFFDEACKGKTPAAFIFADPEGGQWDKDSWYDPIREAAKRADLPLGTSAYTLRHSTITDLIAVAGLDLFTVAKLAGTSVRMIEKTYGHLLDKVTGPALAYLGESIR